MTQAFSRRDWLKAVGATALASQIRPMHAAEGKSMRGVFIILNTPFTAAGAVGFRGDQLHVILLAAQFRVDCVGQFVVKSAYAATFVKHIGSSVGSGCKSGKVWRDSLQF